MATATSLPSIEECLFGPSKVCPKTLLEEDGEEYNENENEAKANATASSNSNNATPPPSSSSSTTTTKRQMGMKAVSNYDSLYAGHWGDAISQEHDINLTKLRRVCSNGIDDAGSYRGIAWRVLLEYLPSSKIHLNWSKAIKPQRELYESLMETYLENKPDLGQDLRGSLGKRMAQNSAIRKHYNELTRLDEQSERDDGSDDDENENEIKGGQKSNGSGISMSRSNSTDDDDDNDENPQAPKLHTSSSMSSQNSSETIETIYDKLPTNEFKDQWKKSGITLDKQIKNLECQTSINLGINHLKVPPDLKTQEEFDIFVQDAHLLEEIRKDVVRTHPDLYFFLEPNNNLGLRRYAAIERILFLWSKLNRGVRYVQGMNEIVGAIYYVLANDHNSDFAIYAEADTYFLFHTIMIDMRDVFVPDLDTSESGIQGRIDNVSKLLKTHDPEVYEHLQECGIDASFFAIRWLTTLLSREFLLPDTIRLWDSMFASTHKENFLRYVCGTMVMKVRDQLLRGDFSKCLRLLQDYPPTNIDDILESSRSLWIYESQINVACHKGGISLNQALQTVHPPTSIIMAFGLKGGQAPKRRSLTAQDSPGGGGLLGLGLAGRAKRFWNGLNTESPNTTPSNDRNLKEFGEIITTNAPSSAPAKIATAVTSPSSNRRVWGRSGSDNIEKIKIEEKVNGGSNLAPAAAIEKAPQSAPLPRRRIWNRGSSGNNTPTSAGTPRSNGNSKTLVGESTTQNGAVVVQVPDLQSPPQLQQHPSPGPPRSRLWNRTGTSPKNQQEQQQQAANGNGSIISNGDTNETEGQQPAAFRMWSRSSWRSNTSDTTATST